VRAGAISIIKRRARQIHFQTVVYETLLTIRRTPLLAAAVPMAAAARPRGLTGFFEVSLCRLE
jgi:hypothetical protein